MVKLEFQENTKFLVVDLYCFLFLHNSHFAIPAVLFVPRPVPFPHFLGQHVVTPNP